jgi:arginine deiminase
MQYGCSSMVNKIESILIKHVKDAFIDQENLNSNWIKFNYISCPDYSKAVEEYDAFAQLLEQNIPNVIYASKNQQTGIDSIYIRDCAFITKKGAILLNMGKKLRYHEPAAIKEDLNKLGIPILGSISGNGKVEGGDILWIDEDTLAIGLGYRTNAEGIQQIKDLTKSFIKNIITVPLPHYNGSDECLHLMSLISPVDKDLAVVYSKLMPVTFREFLIDKGIKLLEVSDKEYETLGCNVLTIAPRKCILIAGNNEIKESLEKEGVTVFEYKGEEISIKGNGGPTCLTNIILA